VLSSHNQFLICKGIDKNGVPYYDEEAEQLGTTSQDLVPRLGFLIMTAMEI
jgi:hypothetical protein